MPALTGIGTIIANPPTDASRAQQFALKNQSSFVGRWVKRWGPFE